MQNLPLEFLDFPTWNFTPAFGAEISLSTNRKVAMQDANPFLPPKANLESNPSETEAFVYAGFWRRFGSYWIDVIVMLPLIAISYFFGEKTHLFNLYWFLPGLLIGLWFHVYLVTRYGGTPGKLLLKTRIAMLDGSRATTKAAFLRYAVLFVLSTLMSFALIIASFNISEDTYFSLGYIERSQRLVALAPPWYSIVIILMQIWIWGEFITMMFNKKRRAVHDFIAGTVVIRL